MRERPRQKPINKFKKCHKFTHQPAMMNEFVIGGTPVLQLLKDFVDF